MAQIFKLWKAKSTIFYFGMQASGSYLLQNPVKVLLGAAVDYENMKISSKYTVKDIRIGLKYLML